MSKKKIKWLKTVSRPGSPLKNTPFLEGFHKFDERVGVREENVLIDGREGMDTWYVDGDEYREFIRRVRERSANLDYLREEIKEVKRFCKGFIAATDKFRAIDLNKKSRLELADLAREIHQQFFDFTFHLWGFLVMDAYLADRLKEQLEKILVGQGKGDRFQEYFTTLTTKTGLVAAEEEELELLEIKSRVQKEGMSKEVDRLIDAHAQKYAWLPVYSYTLKPWDKGHFLRALEILTDEPEEEVRKRRENLKTNKEKIDKVLAELKDPELKETVDIVQEFLVLRTYRTDALRRGFYNLLPFVEDLAKRLKVTADEAAFLSIYEAVDFLEGKKAPSREELRRRAKHHVILKKGEDLKILSKEDEVQRVLKEEVGEVEEEVKELVGEVACPGRAAGKVKIINSVKEADKMEKGNVLVSRMTFPDLMVAITKAAAIVTDEGGITSHASIISRELKIPCVIATEVATKILKDGDLVEVDAEKGVVRKL